MVDNGRIEDLTIREAQVLALHILGRSVQVSARTLQVQPATVASHRAAIRRKIQVPTGVATDDACADRDTVFQLIHRLCRGDSVAPASYEQLAS